MTHTRRHNRPVDVDSEIAQEAFRRRFGVIVIILALAWHFVLDIILGNANHWWILLARFGWGIPQYLILISISRAIRSRNLLIVGASLQFATEMLAAYVAIDGKSSTAAVLLGLQPIYSVLGILPVIFFIDRFWYRP